MSSSRITIRSRTLKLLLCVAITALPVYFFAHAVAEDSAPTVNAQPSDAVRVEAEYSQSWQEGDTETWILRGRCLISQGGSVMRANEMVLWVTNDASGGGKHINAFLDGDVRVEHPGRTFTERTVSLDLATADGVAFQVRRRSANKPAMDDALYRRAWEHRTRRTLPRIRQTQFRAPGPEEPNTTADGPLLQPTPDPETFNFGAPTGGLRRFQVFPRSLVPFSAQSRTSHDTVPAEQITIITGGVNILVEGIRTPDGLPAGPIDLSADRVVIWTEPLPDDSFSPSRDQSPDTPLKFYLEGNVVILQGLNVIKAKRAYYDAAANRAYSLDVELRTQVPKLRNDLRVRANVLRQLSEQTFHAQGAWVTTSEFGKPGYRIQASDIFLDPRPVDSWFGTGEVEIDPVTGSPLQESRLWVESLNNTVYLDELPVFYWPNLKFPAEDFKIPLRRLTYQGDDVFGSQIYTAWDAFMLLGMEEPDNVRWDLLLNWFSDRGPSIGTDVEYKGYGMFNLDGGYKGLSNSFYIHDTGLDNLGRGRRALQLETEHRGRLLMRHRHEFPFEITAWGEVGHLSDYNFLEQYFEDEYDQGKDNETYGYVKQQNSNWAWSLIGRGRLNDFYTVTEWLPRADLYTFSEPLFDGALTWTQHSWLANARLRPAQDPGPAIDPFFNALPWDTNSQGTIASTKHRIDAPFNLGPVIVVPYALGEVTYWEQDAVADELTRLYGSAGIRGSLMFTKYMPHVRNTILNLNGLVHKMLFEVDYYYADSSADLTEVPIYNAFNDNSQEEFTRHLITTTYGGVAPITVDPRFYALRTGAGRAVAAPYHELVDTQHVARLAWRNRWQTKVGPIDRPRIKDWMLLDFETSFFPNPDRDNFGEDFGLFGVNYQWNVGERTSLFAGAAWDLFETGQRLWDAGILTQRSERGSLFVGIRQIRNSAGLDSQIVTLSTNYQMSEKWRTTVATAYDIGENQDRGQSVTVTRLGKDFNLRFGTAYNPSKNTARFGVSIEPRFIKLGVRNLQLDSLDGSGGAR